jgi:hypothetical protein
MYFICVSMYVKGTNKNSFIFSSDKYFLYADWGAMLSGSSPD